MCFCYNIQVCLRLVQQPILIRSIKFQFQQNPAENNHCFIRKEWTIFFWWGEVILRYLTWDTFLSLITRDLCHIFSVNIMRVEFTILRLICSDEPLAQYNTGTS